MAHARTPSAASSDAMDRASDNEAVLVAEYPANPGVGQTPDSDEVTTNQGRPPSAAHCRRAGIAAPASAKGPTTFTASMRCSSVSLISAAVPGDPRPAVATTTSSRP